jgi:hypothetical protein
MVETIDSVKLAKAMNKAVSSANTVRSEPLRFMVQINTSGEECMLLLLLLYGPSFTASISNNNLNNNMNNNSQEWH